MCLTTNQKIAGTVNTLTVWVTNCMGTVYTLSVPIQYTFNPPLSSPLPFSSPPSPPSSPTHRYIVKIYRNLKGTKYSSQVHKKRQVFKTSGGKKHPCMFCTCGWWKSAGSVTAMFACLCFIVYFREFFAIYHPIH
jgi:hypothetical protein